MRTRNSAIDVVPPLTINFAVAVKIHIGGSMQLIVIDTALCFLSVSSKYAKDIVRVREITIPPVADSEPSDLEERV